MNQTNRIPGGFLDLLGAETGGKTPPFYDNKIQPALDMNELYLAQTLTNYTDDVTHSASFAELRINIPSNEFWMIRAVAVQTELYASAAELERWDFCIRRFPRGGQGPIDTDTPYHSMEVLAPFNNQPAAESFWIPAPLLLPPGTQLVARLGSRDATGSRTTRIFYTFDLLRAGT